MNTNSEEQVVTHEGSRPASAEQRLKELGIKLPAPPEPFGTYVEAVQTGNVPFLSGMLPTEGDRAKFIGRVGAELDMEAGTANDIKRLKGCISDLIAIQALPAIWSGAQQSQIVSTLLDLLGQMLDLHFAYLQFYDSIDGVPSETIWVAQDQNLIVQPQEIPRLLSPWLAGPHTLPLRVRDPVGDGNVSILPLRLGLHDEMGVLVVGSVRPDFPSQTERLLLNAATNQATIWLSELRRSSEQTRIAQELNRQVALRTSQLVAANEDLRRDEQELRRMTDAIPQYIMVLAPDGTAMHANQSLLDYTGLTLEDVIAEDFRTRFFHSEDVQQLRDERAKALARGLPFENEQRARRRNGQYRWMLIHYNPFRDEQGRVVRWYATGTDIHDRKEAEERTRNENVALREEIDGASMFEEIVGSSGALRRVLTQVSKVARTDSTVLILGETGTGKELIARAIHRQSNRADRAFIRVNCAAIPSSLIASELFGYEKGAFTGALQRRLGRFESADRGTIFLDEVGELPPETQIALLRVLQEREFERIGSNRPIPVDVRVLAATNRDLSAAAASGAFRRDLYYRFNVFPIQLPPLRERPDDIPLLAEYLIGRYAKKAGKNIRNISRQTIRMFQAYDWPGNIRELQNVVERAVILCESDTLSVDGTWLKPEVPGRAGGDAAFASSLLDREREMIEAALAESRGIVAGPNGAAIKLGIPRQTLDSKIRSLRIDKRRFRAP